MDTTAATPHPTKAALAGEINRLANEFNGGHMLGAYLPSYRRYHVSTLAAMLGRLQKAVELKDTDRVLALAYFYGNTPIIYPESQACKRQITEL